MSTASSRPSILRVSLSTGEVHRRTTSDPIKGYSRDQPKTLEDRIQQTVQQRGQIDQLFISKSIEKENKTVSIPKSKINVVTTLTTLSVLSLRNCNLTSLPKNTFKLVNLKYLGLSHNKFRNWPSQISKLVNLETLLLDNNVLEIPPEFQLATLTKLRVLSLSNNRLKYSPTELSTLGELRELYLDGNSLQYIPQVLLYLEKSLACISLSRNPMDEKDQRLCDRAGIKGIMKYLKRKKAESSQSVIKTTIANEEVVRQENEFDHPKYLDRFNTGALLRRACITFSFDFRRYENQFLPVTINPYKGVIQTCIVNINQLSLSGSNAIMGFSSNPVFGTTVVDDNETSIECSPLVKFILSLHNLNLVVVTYSQKNIERRDLVQRLTLIQNILRLSFHVINSSEHLEHQAHIEVDKSLNKSSTLSFADETCCKFVVCPLKEFIEKNI